MSPQVTIDGGRVEFTTAAAIDARALHAMTRPDLLACMSIMLADQLAAQSGLPPYVVLAHLATRWWAVAGRTPADPPVPVVATDDGQLRIDDPGAVEWDPTGDPVDGVVVYVAAGRFAMQMSATITVSAEDAPAEGTS